MMSSKKPNFLSDTIFAKGSARISNRRRSDESGSSSSYIHRSFTIVTLILIISQRRVVLHLSPMLKYTYCVVSLFSLR